ncbi:type I secretion system permease/ATPase [Mesorhizobium sp. M1E.F.Ca.ET.045.02.1.1]|nr:type I secretion system permease/ATPase [Mesorhizobium sp. M1E.F.Ca.ET.045.02.1.1]RUW74923.1 type I secretion system permease/ATPase [Mesorhizobium sp. M1E.F.Ca.ET.063.01.1.1]RWD87271.1 MAG: type I secretion system permease/ATPase [Mesorhizobium sp.]TKB14105.1 MAG: type I secretion system permease/ATPase [Mesorhizobium sp.]
MFRARGDAAQNAVGDARRRPAAARSKPSVKPTGQVANAARSELAAALANCRSAFLAVGLFSGMLNVLMLAGSLYMLEIYDRVLPSRSLPTLAGISILLVILYCGQGVLDFVRGRVLVRIGGALDEALGQRVYTSVLRLPLKAGREHDSLQPMRDLDSVRGFLSGMGPTALFDLPWLPLYLIIIFMFHWVLGLTALFGAIVLVTLTMLAERLTRKPVSAATLSGNRRGGLVAAGSRNAEVVAAMGMAGGLAARWEDANLDYIADQRKVSDVAGGIGAVSRILRMLLQSSMLGIGAWLVIEQQATAGVIIAASILSGRALAPVDLAIANWKGFAGARQGWQRLTKVLAALPAEAEPMLLPAPSANVMMHNVAIMAPGSQRLLVQDASFAMEAGHALGIIGPSGSGKSTLVRALVGAWLPVVGRIKLDGADLDQWSQAERGRHIGYLPQDVELFAGTVADNIARFETDADPAAIIAAAKAAGAHDLIVGFRQGYETEIGEHGEALSAGQRQRIALARALYRDPFLVVLDEPNSNLDMDGEQALVRAMLGVRERGGVVVIVAHRPNVLAAVDFVLAMSHGRIHEFGPKDKVFAKMFPMLRAVPTANPPPRAAAEGTPQAAANGTEGGN